MDCTLYSFSSGDGRLAVARRVVAVLVAYVLVLCVLGAMGCTGELDPDGGRVASRADSAEAVEAVDLGDSAEARVRIIELAAPLDAREAQISGLTWWDDRLVVLPQYPRVPRRDAPRLYEVPREALAAALLDTATAQSAIEPEPVSVGVDVLDEQASGYQGCEALLFAGDRAYFTIEATGAWMGLAGMRAYVASGTVAPGHGIEASVSTGTTAESTITLTGVEEIPTQTRLKDMAYEALVEHHDTLYALYEANGANVNPSAQVHLFDRELRPVGTRPMPALEYRLTDATSADAQGRFWVINYLYEKEAGKLNPAPDSVALEHGMGASHRRRNAEVVERLVELQITPSGIRRTPTPPIWLRLGSGTGRNWEGIARFGNGFLLATDTFPETLLAYVERPAAQAFDDE